MRNMGFISYIMGLVYITLAIISLSLDLPIRVTNSVSFGAVLLSFSEMLVLITSRKIKRRSFLDILKEADLRDKTIMVLLYIRAILDEKKSILSSRKSILYYLSIIIKALALFFIILLPYTGLFPQLFESSKFGTFCSILSLGIIFLTFYIDNNRDNDKDFKDVNEIIDCYNIALDEKNDMIFYQRNSHSNTETKRKNRPKRNKEK